MILNMQVSESSAEFFVYQSAKTFLMCMVPAILAHVAVMGVSQFLEARQFEVEFLSCQIRNMP